MLYVLKTKVEMIPCRAAANMITRQLIACTKQLKRFASLDFQQKVPIRGINSPLIEIALIYETLNLVCTLHGQGGSGSCRFLL
jgi:hypothetical protein